jgi:exodeoxyribonuclease X
MQLIRNSKISSIDIEGNGRSPAEIVEIAITSIEDGEIRKSKSWLIKPEESISWHAKNVHGISNSDVKDCPSFDDIKYELLGLLENSYLLAHNSHVEANLLKKYLPEWKPLGEIDTLALSRKYISGLSGFSLSNLSDHLDLEELIDMEIEANFHRAGYDSYITALLYFYLLDLDIEDEPIQDSLF